MNRDDSDTRWICWRCADLAYLNADGLCRECAPESVAAEFYQVCIRVVAGESRVVRRVWAIK